MFVLSLLTMLIALPIKWIGYQVSLHYGVSAQSTASWLKDQILDFWIHASCPMYYILLAYSKRRKRWWLYAWCLTVPFTLSLLYTAGRH
ncbi:hypothetical protein ACEQPO_07735 [Bacillus sp. SL00103]